MLIQRSIIAAMASAVLGLAACGGATPSTSQDRPASADAATSAAETGTSDLPAQEPSSQPPAVSEPAAEPTPAVVAPEEFKGSGDKIIKYASGPFIATIDYRGSGNIAVWSLDEDKQEADLLVNETGDYSGTVLAPGDAYFGLKVEAGGKWAISLEPFDQAPTKSGAVSGTGDAVFFWDGPPDTIATITNQGDSNFAVWFYDQDGRDLLVNEIGDYSGEQFIGPGLLQVEAAGGSWSITPE